MANMTKVKEFFMDPADPITMGIYAAMFILTMLWLLKGI